MVKQELKVALKVSVVSKLLIYMYVHVYCVYVCFNRIKCIATVSYSELFSRGSFHDFHELDSIHE